MREKLVAELGSQYEKDPPAEVINTEHNGQGLTIVRFDMPLREAALTRANTHHAPFAYGQEIKDAVDELRHNNVPSYVKDKLFSIASVAFPELEESDYDAVLLNSQVINTLWAGDSLVGFNTYDQYQGRTFKQKILYRGAAAMNPEFRGQGFGTHLYEYTFQNGVDVVATTTRSQEVIHLFNKFAKKHKYDVHPKIVDGRIQLVDGNVQQVGVNVLEGNNLNTTSLDAPYLVRRDHMPVNQKVNLGIADFSATDHLLLLATK